MRLRHIMLAATFLAVLLILMQGEATPTSAFVAAQRVVTLVLAAAIVLGTFVHVDVVCCGEAEAVDRRV